MKSILMKVMIFLSISTPICSNAAEVSGVKVVEIRQRSSSAVIRFDKKFNRSCSDGGVWAIFVSDGTPQMNQMWSLILSAAVSGKKVTIKSSECEYHNKITDVFVYY